MSINCMGRAISQKKNNLANIKYVLKCMQYVEIDIDEAAVTRFFELANGNQNVARYLIAQAVVDMKYEPIRVEYINKWFEEREDHYYDNEFLAWLQSQKRKNVMANPELEIFDFALFVSDNLIDTATYWRELLNS